jgi:heme-degrading monooxygenase HmoA
MVLEIATFDIVPGQEDEFLSAYRTVRDVIASTPGNRSVRMTRGIESPSRFVLLAEWETLEAHTEDFRGTERFITWRAALSPYFAGPPHAEHHSDVE